MSVFTWAIFQLQEGNLLCGRDAYTFLSLKGNTSALHRFIPRQKGSFPEDLQFPKLVQNKISWDIKQIFFLLKRMNMTDIISVTAMPSGILGLQLWENSTNYSYRGWNNENLHNTPSGAVHYMDTRIRV